MPRFNVHLYREMRLDFVDIEAASPEEAAENVRGKPTRDADNVEDCDGEDLSALVDVVGDEDYRQSVTIDFETERQRKAAPKLMAACRMVIDRWERGDLAEAARACQAAILAVTGIDSPLLPHPVSLAHDPGDSPDRAYVLVDGKLEVAIIRTAEGLVIDVYPKGWDAPLDSFTVWDDEIASLEQAAEA